MTGKWPDVDDKIWYSEDQIIEKIATPHLISIRGSYSVKEMSKYNKF